MRPGDTLLLVVEVVGAEPSKSRPDRGRVRLLCRQINQHGETVATWIVNHIFATRGGTVAEWASATANHAALPHYSG